MWEICFLCSVGTFVLLMAFSFPINNSKLLIKYNIKFFDATVFAVMISSVIIFYPINRAGAGKDIFASVEAACLSVYNTVQLFVVRGDLSVVKDGLSGCPEWLVKYYRIWAFAQYGLVPGATLGFALSFVQSLSTGLRCRMTRGKDIYVFSELNEKSAVLARDYKNRYRKAVIIFAGVDNNEADSVLLDEARTLRAICLKTDITVVNLKKNSKKNYTKFFLIGRDEDRNLIQAVKLIEKCKSKKRRNAEIYVFSKKVESGLVLSSMDTAPVKVRRINEVRLLVNRILQHDGQRLFETALPVGSDSKTISAVIVGLGSYGTEMMKALTWYGQMDGYAIEINAFDQDKNAESKIAAVAPILTQSSGGDGEARFKINVHSETDVDQRSFWDAIKRLPAATYVFVALGDDEDNIRTAVNLRTHFAKRNMFPMIQAIVYDSKLKQALQESSQCAEDGSPVCKLKTFEGRSYGIEFVGDVESSFTKDVIEPEIEEAALKIHLQYKPDGTDLSEHEKNFWRYEYNYNSSISTAIHMEAIKKCNLPQGKTADKRFLEELEHRRWIAYMSSEGYEYGKKKDHLAKTHPALTEYKKLDHDEYHIVSYEQS